MISRLNENSRFGSNSRVELETKISQNFRLPYCTSALHLLQENSMIAKISCVLSIISMYYWKYWFSFCSSFSVNASIISTQWYNNAQRSTWLSIGQWSGHAYVHNKCFHLVWWLYKVYGCSSSVLSSKFQFQLVIFSPCHGFFYIPLNK